MIIILSNLLCSALLHGLLFFQLLGWGILIHQISKCPFISIPLSHWLGYTCWPLCTIWWRYVRDLMNHMTAYIVDLSGKHDLKNMSQQPETILMVSHNLRRTNHFSVMYISVGYWCIEILLGYMLIGATTWSFWCFRTPDTKGNLRNGLFCDELCSDTSWSLQAWGIEYSRSCLVIPRLAFSSDFDAEMDLVGNCEPT